MSPTNTTVAFMVGAALTVAMAPRHSVAAPSTEHLLPETGFFGYPEAVQYSMLLRQHLIGDSRSWARLVITPSHQREESIAIEGNDLASATLVHRKAKESIWIAYSKSAEASRGADAEHYRAAMARIAIPVDQHTATLPADLQSRIVRAWVALLRTTHYGPFTHNEDDGTDYHFTAFVLRRELLAGRVWNPPDESLPGAMVSLGSQLIAFADATPAARTALLPKIEKAVSKAEWLLGLRPDQQFWER